MSDIWKTLLSGSIHEMCANENAPMTEVDRRITEAALELFAEHGYDGAKTLAIAKRAGVSEKTLFQHFGSKEQLFAKTVYPSLLQLIQPHIHGSFACVEQNEPLTLRECLEHIAKNRLEFAMENPQIIKFLLQELLLRTPYREAVTELWMEQLAPLMGTFFERFKEKGEIRDLPVAVIMRVIVPIFVSYSLIRSLMAPDQEDWNDDEEISMMLDIVLNGLHPR